MNIEDIASKHLGKAGDGTIVKPYVTPNSIDPSLLVGVPRELNRTAYGIDEKNLPFVGWDVWNAYEFSALTDLGMPVVAVLKITYRANSRCIVESKSLKLYLNSFNLVRLGESYDVVIARAKFRIEKDLSELLETKVSVQIFTANQQQDNFGTPIDNVFTLLDNIELTNEEFTYSETPDLLVAKEPSIFKYVNYRVAALRSNCRVTNQPDWGDVYVRMIGDSLPTPESFLRYIVSMRNENHFHEEICECIYKRLYDKFAPEELFVACLYTRRGGIDINPIRASNYNLIDKCARRLLAHNPANIKTWRQ